MAARDHNATHSTNALVQAFLRKMNASTSLNATQAHIREVQVAFMACDPLNLGGVQLRCVETARQLTTRGTPAVCIDGETKTIWKGPATCMHGVRRLETYRDAPVQAVVFLKTIPGKDALKRLVERRPNVTLVFDTMDLDQPNGCYPQLWAFRYMDAFIFDNHAARSRVFRNCAAIAKNAARGRPQFLIEHFHSVTRRVSDGRTSVKNVLFQQEHPITAELCSELRNALPKSATQFLCNGNSRGATARERFLSGQLNVDMDLVHSVVQEPEGTGALFTALYQKFDLLLHWRDFPGTVQRLANQLATGVPVIAKAGTAYAETFAAHPGILFANSTSQLRELAAMLNEPSFRRRVSDAGVAASEQFSKENIIRQYQAAFRKLAARPRALLYSSAVSHMK